MKHLLAPLLLLILTAAVGPSTEIDVRVVPPPPAGSVIEPIRLCSTSGADVRANTPSPPMFPLEFKKGDVPAGQYPQLQATDGTPWGVTFINVRHWSDGSWKIAGVLPGPFPKAIPTACVSANVLNGGTAPAPSGLTAATMYSEQILANANGFSGALGTGLSFTGNWSSKLANDANRIEEVDYGDGQGGRVYRILSHVQQSGTAHGQMEVYWYVQQLLNASGGLAGYRVLPRLTQPWYNQPTPAADWRGLQTFNIQWGSGPTTITPPYPLVNTDFPASGYTGGNFNPAVQPSWNATCGQQECWAAGYFTTTGTFPTGLSVNTMYCVRSSQFRPYTTLITSCSTGGGPNITDAGTGTHTFHPTQLLLHFGSLWGARADGRYSYLQGSGTVAADAPIQIKGNKVYDQSTGIFPPYDLSLSPTPNSNPDPMPFSTGSMAFSNNTTSVIGTNLDGTGERDEIGIRNAWCARWFYNRSLLDEKYVRVNGLVSGMWANAVRDLTTRGPIHLGDPAKSYAGMPVSSATTFNWSTPGNTGGFTLPAHGGVALFFGVNDLSHMPDLSGCAYLATGEPQYLDLQMEWANEAIFGNITPLRNGTVGGVNYYGVTTYGTQNLFRMPAWGLRAQVDADAWWPDRDPAGTATGTYLHDQARASTHLPTVSIPLETSWAATNCYWRFPGGSSRGPWNFFYMVNVLIDAASNNEDADAKSLLNCTATWLNHAYGAFNGDYSLWATAEAPYDLGKDDGGPFILANLSWAAGIATITLPSEGNLFTGEVMNVQGVGYNGVYTITRTGPTTATFPLVADPGGPAVGQLNAVAQLVTSDAMFSSLYGVAPPTSIIYLAWNSGTPGSVAQVFTDYSAYGSFTPGGQSWQPANGDKYIFPPYYGGSPFTLPPGGLVVSQPYYIVNTHAGPISGMSWASGTLTVTTPAHRIPVASTVVMGINGNTSVGGIYGTNLTCHILNTMQFTCPLTPAPSLPPTVLGEYNTSQIAASPGGTPLNLTDSGTYYLFGVVPANPPANYPVGFVNPDAYLANGRGAVNGMIACGVTGLSTIQAAAESRLAGSRAYFGLGTIGRYFQSDPKNAMAASFGSGGGCGAPSPPPTPPAGRRGGRRGLHWNDHDSIMNVRRQSRHRHSAG